MLCVFVCGWVVGTASLLYKHVGTETSSAVYMSGYCCFLFSLPPSLPSSLLLSLPPSPSPPPHPLFPLSTSLLPSSPSLPPFSLPPSLSSSPLLPLLLSTSSISSSPPPPSSHSECGRMQTRNQRMKEIRTKS